MTRGEFITVVAAKLGLDDTGAGSEWLLMERWCQEGVVEVLLRTHCYTEIGDMALTPGVSEYRVDEDILAIQNDQITSSGSSGTITLISMDEMIERRAASSAVGRIGVVTVAIEGNLLITYPAPSSGDTIRYFYVPRPTTMTLDANDPSAATYGGIPTEYHKAIEYYMLWQAAEYDDKKAPMTPQDYYTAFETLCKEYRQHHRGRSQRGLLPARVGYPQGRNFGRRNDVF